MAVVGSGTGNDVAAALRSGARHVDAIEIDPAILMLGQTAHPEHPYQDPRVHAIVNDARSFLRTTDQTYDMIVYGCWILTRCSATPRACGWIRLSIRSKDCARRERA